MSGNTHSSKPRVLPASSGQQYEHNTLQTVLVFYPQMHCTYNKYSNIVHTSEITML